METRPTRDHPALRERDALQLLRVAMDLPEVARDTFVQGECDDDPWLLQRVRELLACADEPSGDAACEGHGLRRADARRPPALLGAWRLLRSLGRGGMGEVWLAERADGAFERQVAIKRICGGAPLLATRFLRERSILARMQHPNIATLLDGGLDDAGQPWFAMEYVSGQRIDRWCDARRRTLHERVDLLVRLCHAVQFAHGHLVVHRDIKPANVLVGDDGTPKLLDFGIARMLDDAEPTQTQWLMTPAYAAPEQRRGEAPGTATDVYQLGLLLRELLVGHSDGAPLRLDADYQARRRSDPARAQAIAHARRSTPDALQSQLRGDLSSIVALATAECASARYASPAALAQDLQRWQQREPVHARADERGYRLRRSLRRRWPWLATAVGAVVFAVYHFYSVSTALEQAEAETVRVLAAEAREADQRMRAERERDKAFAVSDYFIKMFSMVGPAKVGAGISARSLLEQGRAGLENVDAKADKPPAARSAMWEAIATIHANLGEYQLALQAADKAEANARAGNDDPAIIEALRAKADALSWLDRSEEALKLLLEALEIVERAALKDAPAFGQVHNDLALIYMERGNTTAAFNHARISMDAIRKRNTGQPKLGFVQALNNNGLIALNSGHRDLAREWLSEAEATYPRLANKNPSTAVLVQANLALLELQERRAEASRRRLERLLPDCIAHFGERGGRTAMVHQYLGVAQLAGGEITQALASFRRAQELYEEAFGGDARQSRDNLVLIATALYEAQEPALASKIAVRLRHWRAQQHSMDAMLAMADALLARNECDVRGLADAVLQLSHQPGVFPWQLDIVRRWQRSCEKA